MKAIKRLYQYLDYKGIKPARFEKENDLSNGYLGTQLKRNGNLGEDVFNKIIDNCLDLNPVWLLTGKQKMIKNQIYSENSNNEHNNFVNESQSEDDKYQKQNIPLFDVHASAATLFDDESTEKLIDQITVPNLPKCDGAVYVSSDSMYPLLKSGDIIIYKKITTSVGNIYWGEMYLISLVNDEGDEFVMVKWIHKSEKGEEFIKLVSENKHHQPKDFNINAVKGLALIKASIRINATY